MTLLSQYLYIHFQFISNYKFYFILNNQWRRFIFKTRGKTFYFLFCSLRSICQIGVHVECRPVVSFRSLPLVALCSPSVPDHSFMSPPTFINSFTLNCPKYWCFCLFHHLLLTHMIILTTFSLLYCCHLFQCVALCFLSVPLSFEA